MSESTTDQPHPVHTTHSEPVHPVLLQILEEQRAKGRRYYGCDLHTHNGRDPLVDALQEAVDALQYLTQALMEAQDRIARLEATNSSPQSR